MSTEKKNILRIDASTLQVSDCARQVYLQNIQGYQPKRGNVNLVWGNAIHKGIAHWVLTRDKDTAIQRALDYYEKQELTYTHPVKDEISVEYVLNKYFIAYKEDSFAPLEANGKLAIELPFKIPFYATPKTDVILCGMMDAIGTESKPCFKDIKTSSSYNPNKYFTTYENSLQMMIYTWVIKHLGIYNYYLPVVIDGIFCSKSGIKMQRSAPIDYSPLVIDRMMDWARKRVAYITQCYETNDYPYNFSRCKHEYGTCTFIDHCKMQDAYQEQNLSGNFTQRTYDPTNF